MNVVHVVPALFAADDGLIGGAERYVLELARHMAVDVPTRLVTFGDRDREETLGPLRISVIGRPWHVRGQRTNPFAFRTWKPLRNADVVHCHQQHVLTSSIVALWCRATSRSVFVTDLGGGGWDFSAYMSTDRWYDGHLHLSEYSRRIFGHIGQPRVHVIGGGVDTARFCPEGPMPSDGSILFVGRLLPHKGVDDLIRAVPSDMPVELIGPAPDPAFLQDLRALAVGKRVVFRHGITDSELVGAYRRALCVVLPSVYRTAYGQETRMPELLGQTLLEGMACGIPAVCTDVASLPEVVEHGVTGLVVPPNNPEALGRALQWLRDHPQAAATMGEMARRRVLTHFTWPAIVKRCLDIYSAHCADRVANRGLRDRALARRYVAE